GELFDRQIELLPVTRHDASQGVKLDARRPEDSWVRHRLASGEGADSEDEFGEVERFSQVVVGPEVETSYAIPRGVGSGQHEDHTRLVALGDHAAHDVAV